MTRTEKNAIKTLIAQLEDIEELDEAMQEEIKYQPPFYGKKAYDIGYRVGVQVGRIETVHMILLELKKLEVD